MTQDEFSKVATDHTLKLVGGVKSELARIIRENDLRAAYDEKFIQGIAALGESEWIRAAALLKEKFPKDFKSRDWRTLVKLERERVKSAAADATRHDWRDLLIEGDTGPKALLANAITALRHAPEWRGVLAYDEFSMQTVIMTAFPGGDRSSGPWSDRDDISTANWMQHAGILVKPDAVAHAVELVSKDNTFHPVRRYLDALQWDGEARIGSWLAEYLGAVVTSEDDEGPGLERYVSHIGARWLISAVARIYVPGCKVDTSLILEGPQGARKSTALKILGDPWFTDELGEFGAKDTSMQTAGVWIIEIGELDAMSRSEVSAVKVFLSRPTDRFRPPYGRRIVKSPRQCVFAGTVNHSTYLKDETGGRRFWPFVCGEINAEALRRDRDQLWAEAVKCFQDGQQWWLNDSELEATAREEQSKRYVSDPWDAAIEEWLNKPDRAVLSDESVSVAEILGEALKIDKARWSVADSQRAGRFLKARGWIRFKKRTPEGFEWRYRPRAEKDGWRKPGG